MIRTVLSRNLLQLEVSCWSHELGNLKKIKHVANIFLFANTYLIQDGFI